MPLIQGLQLRVTSDRQQQADWRPSHYTHLRIRKMTTVGKMLHGGNFYSGFCYRSVYGCFREKCYPWKSQCGQMLLLFVLCATSSILPAGGIRDFNRSLEVFCMCYPSLRSVEALWRQNFPIHKIVSFCRHTYS